MRWLFHQQKWSKTNSHTQKGQMFFSPRLYLSVNPLLFLLFQVSPQSRPTSATATMQSNGQRFLSKFRICSVAKNPTTKKKKRCNEILCCWRSQKCRPQMGLVRREYKKGRCEQKRRSKQIPEQGYLLCQPHKKT